MDFFDNLITYYKFFIKLCLDYIIHVHLDSFAEG